MQFKTTQQNLNHRDTAVWTGQRPSRRILLCIVALAALTGIAQQNPDKSIHDSSLTAPPDANAQMRMRDQQDKNQSYEVANTARKKQIADDSALLLKLATDLKTEVDKTDKDTLSISVIRKADAIERLAHNVKEKMKLTIGAS